MTSPKMVRTKEPSIYKRGNRYVFVWRHHGRQHKEFFPTLALAREAKRRRQGGDRRKRPRIRVRDYAERWIVNYRGRTSRGFSETTRDEYRRDLETRLLPFLGGWWLAEVEPPDIRDWFAWMEGEGLSGSAIRKAKATASAMFATAAQDGVIRSNPVLGVRYVPAESVPSVRPIKPLTLAELNRLMAALSKRDKLLILLLAHTGIRIGELLGLTWSDVHLGDDPTVAIRDQVYRGKRKALKTEAAYRTIPLSPGMAFALTEWHEETAFPGQGFPVFPSRAGNPLDYSRLHKRIWIAAREDAGIDPSEYGAFHRLRKTLGSLAHERGEKTNRQLADWLGHADPSFTTRVYVSQLDQGLGSAAFLDETIPVDLTPPSQPPVKG